MMEKDTIVGRATEFGPLKMPVDAVIERKTEISMNTLSATDEITEKGGK